MTGALGAVPGSSKPDDDDGGGPVPRLGTSRVGWPCDSELELKEDDSLNSCDSKEARGSAPVSLVAGEAFKPICSSCASERSCRLRCEVERRRSSWSGSAGATATAQQMLVHTSTHEHKQQVYRTDVSTNLVYDSGPTQHRPSWLGRLAWSRQGRCPIRLDEAEAEAG